MFLYVVIFYMKWKYAVKLDSREQRYYWNRKKEQINLIWLHNWSHLSKNNTILRRFRTILYREINGERGWRIWPRTLIPGCKTHVNVLIQQIIFSVQSFTVEILLMMYDCSSVVDLGYFHSEWYMQIVQYELYNK